jgi:hypothetical protein
MNAPAFPTMGPNGIVTDIREIIPRVLQHYLTAPKSATETWIKDTISLSARIAEFTGDDEGLSSAVQRDLETVYGNITGEPAAVEVTIEQRSPTETSLRRIRIIPTATYQNQPYSALANITASDTGLLEFDIT